MVKAAHLYATLLAAVAVASSCTTRNDASDSARDSVPSGQGVTPSSEAPDSRPVVLFVGTSLTAGLGLDPQEAYPALVQGKIDSAGLEYQVVNAGVSGQTSAGARNSIDWLLRRPVAALVIETGANDGLRGIDPDELRANLDAIIDRAQEQQPAPFIVLAGMQAPPNLGSRYTSEFREVYRSVARERSVQLIPFLLEGVAGIDSLNQADGIHPTEAGQALLAHHVWAVLGPVLQGGR